MATNGSAPAPFYLALSSRMKEGIEAGARPSARSGHRARKMQAQKRGTK